MPWALIFGLQGQLFRAGQLSLTIDHLIDNHPVPEGWVGQLDDEPVEVFVHSFEQISEYQSERILVSGFHMQFEGTQANRIIARQFQGDPLPGPNFVGKVNTALKDERKIDLAKDDILSMFQHLLMVSTHSDNGFLAAYHSQMPEMKGISVLLNPRATRAVLVKSIINFFAVAGTATLGAGVFFLIYARIVVRNIMKGVRDDQKILGLQATEATKSSEKKPTGQTIQNMQEELVDHFQRQSRLARLGTNASYLAHDIRNILANLQLNADRLSTMGGASESEIGNNLSKSIEQCVSLLNWAVLFSSENARSFETEEVYLRPILQEAIEFSQNQSTYDIACVLECDDQFIIETNRTFLFRAVYNLLHNSVKEMRGQTEFSQIRIFVQQVDEVYELYISDTGGGFSIEGEQNYRNLNIQKLRRGSNGLGLKIAHDLIDWLGGAVELTRSNAAGTQFLITLPRSWVAPLHLTESTD